MFIRQIYKNLVLALHARNVGGVEETFPQQQIVIVRVFISGVLV